MASSARIALGCTLLILGACGVHAPEPAARTCSLTPPTTAVAPPWDRMVELAGRYDLTLVNTAGEYGDSVERGVLELWVNDSLRRYGFVQTTLGRLRGERPLAGAFESESPVRHGDYRASRERARPGVELIGPSLLGGGPVLYLGGIDVTDGAGERLRIRAVGPEGFWGAWAYDGGLAVAMETATRRILANPAGHFCALRRRDT